MKTVYELVSELQEHFDENANEPQQHSKSAALFYGLSHAWCGSDPRGNGWTWTPEESALFDGLLELKTIASGTSSSMVREVHRGLCLMAEFCSAKFAACHYRLKGNIPPAVRQERIADKRYEALPPDWRW